MTINPNRKIPKLKRCPICRHKAEIRENILYYSNAFRVKCTYCHLSTQNFATDVRTDDEAINLASARWNERRLLPWAKRTKRETRKI